MNSAVAAEIYAPAARAALSEFLIDVAALELVSVSENVTFRLTDRRSGAAFVLRLHRPGYHTLAELEAERVWIRALADAGVAVPGPVTARNGREYIQVHIPGADEQRYVGVSEWTDGELLADVLQRDDRAEVFDQSFTALGALTATLHNQAGNWRVPANFSRHAVDEDGLLGEAPFWGRFWEHPLLSATQRQQLLATREQLRAALRRYGCAASTYSIIHADLHPGNVLINGDRLTVIDFDDAGFGWHQYDIAVALRHLQQHREFELIKRAFVAGYRTTRALSDAALALVPMFLLIRGMALIGWIHQRPELQRKDIDSLIKSVCAACETFEVPC